MTFDKKEIETKWSKPENWHITIVFLGEKEESEIPELWNNVKLACKDAKPFEIRIENVGAFPDNREARILWFGVQKSNALLQLQNKIELALEVNRSQEYIPHMTFGRLRNMKSVWDIIKPFARKTIGKLKVEEIVLFESIQSGKYPIYKPLEKINLQSS